MENPIASMFRYNWKYSKGRRHILVFYLSLSFVAAVLLLFQPLVIARLFNAIQFNTGEGLINAVFVNLALFFGLTIAALAIHHTSRIIELNHSFIITKNYRSAMFEKTLYLPLQWHKEHHSGETIDRINKAAGSLGGFSSATYNILQTAVRIIGSVLILLLFDLTSGLIAVAAALLTFWVLWRFDDMLMALYKTIMRFENHLAAGIQDYLANIRTVVTLRMRPRVVKEIEERSMLLYPAARRSNMFGELKWAFLSFTVPLAEVIILALYAYNSYIATGIIAIGSMYALYSYLNNVAGTFSSFAGNYGNIMRQKAAMDAAEDIERDYERQGLPKQEMPHADWKEIRVQHLTFRYEETQQLKLDDVDITFRKGQRIALIGESGSGKSTLLSVLRGLYEPQQATVLIDGKKSSHGLLSIHGTVMLLPQEPEIFNTSISDNITMGISTSAKRIIDAAAIARFTPVLGRLDNGLKTEIREKGINLSGGEKQRLALARGVLAAYGCDIVLLDEPTSSVDPANEQAVYQNIFSAFPDKTIISSVHRLHLLDRFDYVYCLHKGKVLAEGTPAEVKRNRHFKKLAAHMKAK